MPFRSTSKLSHRSSWAVVALLAKHLGVSLVAANGCGDRPQALLEKTILDAGQAGND